MILSFILSFLLQFSSPHLQLDAEKSLPQTVAPCTLNKKLMLQLLNTVRASGCRCEGINYKPAPPLCWNDLLEAAAQKHSNDMFQKNYFNHIEGDGSNGGTRIDAAGYKWMTYGENIGMGYRNEKEVVAAWLKSPGHCKNIMNPQYKEVGVACAGLYWTQDFGAQ